MAAQVKAVNRFFYSLFSLLLPPLTLISLTLCLSLSSHSHLISLLISSSLCRFSYLTASLMSAMEVRVWLFYPPATRLSITMAVTPAQPATRDPALLRLVQLPLHQDNGTKGNHKSHAQARHTFSHVLWDFWLFRSHFGTGNMYQRLLNRLECCPKNVVLWCDCEVN